MRSDVTFTSAGVLRHHYGETQGSPQEKSAGEDRAQGTKRNLPVLKIPFCKQSSYSRRAQGCIIIGLIPLVAFTSIHRVIHPSSPLAVTRGSSSSLLRPPHRPVSVPFHMYQAEDTGAFHHGTNLL
ncbi:unnamed protein product [Allacma fusca]|uniref:Uncharacterized protein n=1 Tax=Allacma fusca TaxID=39272 RepID=A0A8J2LZZ4_9HEXA|nr:unnamed protein product [Allacma fusca]